ncbi:pseudouridine synthase [Clostridium sp. Marseille-P2415]|uniref:pseudouridine synthase n=1 Tax=Clostridium sp. Marseille-P2415 TaxID=1805471 RepID=UPI00190EFC98|nr:pseudouridine synthase [Clostridium sp. Marseille-P2415]
MEAEGIRLNKFLSEAGICSRREADRLIGAGKVRINGQAVSPGQKVLPGQSVTVNGRTITTDEEEKSHKAEQVLLAVHKPRGIVCTTSEKDRAPNIVDMVNYPVRIYPIGRLDKDSEGLILMTNQGGLVNKMMRSGNAHEKEYLVKVNRPVTDDFIRKMRKGVFLPELNVTTRPCFAAKAGEKAFRIILTEGLNRQIRRMCSQFCYEVRMLKRMRIMNIELGDLKPGAYRELSKREYHQMKEALKGSTNLSYKEQKKEKSDGR